VDGTVTLADSGFADPDSGIAVSGIAGDIEYDERGFAADALAAEYRGKPARLRLAADAGAEEKFRADLQGTSN
jgi:hypothetical protein